MKYCAGDQIFDQYISQGVYKDTQAEEKSVALTAAEVFKFTSAGELDFGGSEFKPADKEEIKPELRAEGDDYGWWKLIPGGYRMKLNEVPGFSGEAGGIIQPHDHLLEAGGYHPTLWLTAEDSNQEISLPLRVNDPGVKIKENARVSEIMIIES